MPKLKLSRALHFYPDPLQGATSPALFSRLPSSPPAFTRATRRLPLTTESLVTMMVLAATFCRIKEVILLATNSAASTLLIFLSTLLASCGTTGGASQAGTQSDPNFIAAPNLTQEKLDKLWSIATNKCYDFAYTVTNNDKATKNIVCTTQSSGYIMTLRVRFANEGIFVTLQSSSAAWALMGGSLGPMTTEHQEMKKALIAGLS